MINTHAGIMGHSVWFPVTVKEDPEIRADSAVALLILPGC